MFFVISFFLGWHELNHYPFCPVLDRQIRNKSNWRY